MLIRSFPKVTKGITNGSAQKHRVTNIQRRNKKRRQSELRKLMSTVWNEKKNGVLRPVSRNTKGIRCRKEWGVKTRNRLVVTDLL